MDNITKAIKKTEQIIDIMNVSEPIGLHSTRACLVVLDDLRYLQIILDDISKEIEVLRRLRGD